jgi:hypothetical protein
MPRVQQVPGSTEPAADAGRGAARRARMARSMSKQKRTSMQIRQKHKARAKRQKAAAKKA